MCCLVCWFNLRNDVLFVLVFVKPLDESRHKLNEKQLIFPSHHVTTCHRIKSKWERIFSPNHILFNFKKELIVRHDPMLKLLNESRCKLNERQINSVWIISNLFYCISLLFSLLNLKHFSPALLSILYMKDWKNLLWKHVQSYKTRCRRIHGAA